MALGGELGGRAPVTRRREAHRLRGPSSTRHPSHVDLISSPRPSVLTQQQSPAHSPTSPQPRIPSPKFSPTPQLGTRVVVLCRERKLPRSVSMLGGVNITRTFHPCGPRCISAHQHVSTQHQAPVVGQDSPALPWKTRRVVLTLRALKLVVFNG